LSGTHNYGEYVLFTKDQCAIDRIPVVGIVGALRGHMQWEELDLFRRVEEMISEGHELLETATILQTSDPVFGKQVEAKFSRLYESVQERLVDDE